MRNMEKIDQLEAWLDENRYLALREELENLDEVEISEIIDELPSAKALKIFRLLKKDQAAEVFAELEPGIQGKIIHEMTDRELEVILDEMFVDDLVDMLEELPASVVTRVLEITDEHTRGTINRFLKYPKDSAGSLMTSEYTSLKKDLRVEEAIAYLRSFGHDNETLYSCYVVADDRTLEGVVTLRTLLLASDEALVESLMDSEVVSVSTDLDQEHVADLFMKYDFMTIPVVDSENHLVGIVTVDDIIDVMREEDTEDFEKMAGTLPSDKPYLKTSVWELAKNRMGWLTILMISGVLTGNILAHFEHAFISIPLLVSFIPMLTDTGGNSGSQSSTLVIRGMVLNEIKFSDGLKVLWKEFQVSLMAGAFLALITYLRLIYSYPDKPMIVFVVALSIQATVIMAKLIGALLPFAAKLLRADPAIMAAPMITTIVDAGSLFVYFYLAHLILGI
ncbi:magnesium transporter [Proteiniclasticum sp. BAD-10]|uniref:Magnesium transporter MgtE n=1 Tax=Proteiniclasticum sediminis TaxID=2804028 RepID=A0A941HQ63_9CLOT|nr:magnesium transporter [Proteiniclasticum sediminis]MBR0576131.1 magnesium transporter [Proteiniclasticum sediminis]